MNDLSTQLTRMFTDLESSFLGYDRFFRDVQANATKAMTNWPPFNVRKVNENKYVVEMAVAGFGQQDIEIMMGGGKLTVRGSNNYDNSTDGPQEFLHQGIANRAFTRAFSVADTMVVHNAELVNGMLKIWLENLIPETQKVRKIEIGVPATEKQLLQEKAA